MREVCLGRLNMGCVGLGTRGLGGEKKPEAEWLSVIDRALELGITYLDTAGHYGAGEAQDLVGKAVKGRRSRFQVGIHVGTPGPGGVVADAGRVRAELGEALTRLGTDYVDLMQLHYPDPGSDYEEVARLVEELRDGGVVREFGLSNFGQRELSRWPGWSRPASIQLPYNLIQRSWVDDLRETLREREMRVIAYMPLLAGVLTAAGVGGDPGPGLGGIIYGLLDDGGRRCLNRLGEAARGAGLSPAGLAVAWTLLDPDVALAVVGAGSMDHLEQVSEAVTAGDDLRDVLDDLGRERPAEPVLPLPGVVVAILEDEGREVLAEVRFDLGGREIVTRRWLPQAVRVGDRLRWDGLADRILDIV